LEARKHQKKYTADKAKKGKELKSGSYSGIATAEKNPYVILGSNVEYAPHIETGTSKKHARPFIKPALTDHVDQYRRMLKAELSRE
jgi:phage gpG-like protein